MHRFENTLTRAVYDHRGRCFGARGCGISFRSAHGGSYCGSEALPVGRESGPILTLLVVSNVPVCVPFTIAGRRRDDTSRS
jgi:hypothetical protein